MSKSNLDYLEELESEAIHVMREVREQFERPAILFSGGKDSTVLVHLAHLAFKPEPIPFPIVHIDTGHNFPEVLTFRDELVQRFDLELMVGSVQESIDIGSVQEETGADASRNYLQSVTLLETINRHNLDACMGGGRRDEEKARAKERFFSHRDKDGQWKPSNQRPELWHLFNGRMNLGEHFRIFPISNWTELDVWAYIRERKIELPSLYFAHEREVFERKGTLLAVSPYIELRSDERATKEEVRYRTCGDMTISGAVRSSAKTIDAVMEEIKNSKLSERGGRTDDLRSESAMEDRKKEGYF